MGQAKDKLLPGTAGAYVERSEKGFSRIEMLLEATGGLSLSQVCSVTGLEGSTIQNWVKRGWVAHPSGKKYEEIHIARILIINALKECIKLEHIALLMEYVNGTPGGIYSDTINESELYNYLCEALMLMGQAADQSRGGAEAVVETIIRDYQGPNLESKLRIRKALTVMIFACVCTDVKRRTEAMMDQILDDLQNPAKIEAEAIKAAEEEEAEAIKALLFATDPEDRFGDETTDDYDAPSVTRKTVSQALREWDFSSVERIIIDPVDESKTAAVKPEEEKPSNRPWYVRKTTK